MMAEFWEKKKKLSKMPEPTVTVGIQQSERGESVTVFIKGFLATWLVFWFS